MDDWKRDLEKLVVYFASFLGGEEREMCSRLIANPADNYTFWDYSERDVLELYQTRFGQALECPGFENNNWLKTNKSNCSTALDYTINVLEASYVATKRFYVPINEYTDFGVRPFLDQRQNSTPPIKEAIRNGNVISTRRSLFSSPETLSGVISSMKDVMEEWEDEEEFIRNVLDPNTPPVVLTTSQYFGLRSRWGSIADIVKAHSNTDRIELVSDP